jgi:hypothetical protein
MRTFAKNKMHLELSARGAIARPGQGLLVVSATSLHGNLCDNHILIGAGERDTN